MDSHQFRNLGLILAISVLQGCGGDDSKANRTAVFPITGKVTMAGSPVIGANVTFSPVGQQPAAMGRTNDEGVYVLTTYEAEDGAAAGDYKVLISKDAVSKAAAPPAHSVTATGTPPSIQHGANGKKASASSGSVLPARYSDRGKTDLTCTVKEGENQCDFELKP